MGYGIVMISDVIVLLKVSTNYTTVFWRVVSYLVIVTVTYSDDADNS